MTEDTHELLRKLRAAGAELKPMAEGDIALVLEDALTGQRYLNEFAVRLAADLLEARAKLAEVQQFAEQVVATEILDDTDWGYRNAGKELLEILILDKEPEP